MRRGKPPDRGWGVWIGHFERRQSKLEWNNNAFLVTKEKKARVRPDHSSSHFYSNSSTQVVGKLFVQIVHCPMPGFVDGWRFSLPNNGSLFRIWPPSGVSIKWPGLPMTDADAETVSDAISEFLLNLKQDKVCDCRVASHCNLLLGLRSGSKS